MKHEIVSQKEKEQIVQEVAERIRDSAYQMADEAARKLLDARGIEPLVNREQRSSLCCSLRITFEVEEIAQIYDRISRLKEKQG